VKIKTILIILAGLLIGCSDFNTEPVITSLTADNTTVSPGGTVLLTCTAEDDNDDSLTYIGNVPTVVLCRMVVLLPGQLLAVPEPILFPARSQMVMTAVLWKLLI